MVDDRPAWLGRSEDARLEFKSKEALRHPESIARAVVSMLNGKGGQVVVGVDDQGAPEPVDLRSHKERLQNILLENVEPAPKREVHVSVIATMGSHLLEIDVRPRPRTLYAERRQGMYGFWIRSGPTTRALTLHEAQSHWHARAEPEVTVQRWDEPLARRDEREIVFVLQAQLREDEKLDRKILQQLLTPERIAQWAGREMGWTIVSRFDRLERRGHRLDVGAQGKRSWLSCDSSSGIVRFEARSSFLLWKAPDAIREPVIYPYPLVEGVANFFWFLRQYGLEAKTQGPLSCQLGIWHPEGYRLGPGAPDSASWQWPTEHNWQPPHDERNIERALEVEWAEITLSADEVALRFIEHVYEDFGYSVADVPFWDSAQRRFFFPA